MQFSGVVLLGTLLVPPALQEQPRALPGRLTQVRQIGQAYPLSSASGFSRLTFSREGDKLAALDTDGTVQVWSTTDQGLLKSFKIKSHVSAPLMEFLDDDRLLIASADGVGQIHGLKRDTDPVTWELGRSCLRLIPPATKGGACYIAGATLRSIDSTSGKILREFKDADQAITAMVLSADSLSLFTGGRTLRVWEVGTGRLLRKIAECEPLVTSMALARGGNRLLVGHQDGKLVEWDLKEDRPTIVLERSTPPAGEVVWCDYADRDDSVYVLRSRGSLVRIEKAEIKDEWSVAGFPIVAFSTSPKAGLLALAEQSSGTAHRMSRGVPDRQLRHNILLWHLASGKPHSLSSAPNLTQVRTLSATSGGGRILAMTKARALLWDEPRGSLLQALSEDLPQFSGGVISPDGKRLYFCARPCDRVRIWNLESGVEEASAAVGQTLWNFSISKDGNLLAAQSVAGVHAFNPTTRTSKLTIPTGTVMDVHCLSRDGKYCAVADVSRRVAIWDVDSGKAVEETTLEQSIGSLSFGPADLLYLGGPKGITSWDWKSRKVEQHPTDYPISAVTWVKDGIIAIAAGPHLKCFDVGTWKEVAAVVAHSGEITHLIEAGGKNVLVTAGTEGTVKIWEFSLVR